MIPLLDLRALNAPMQAEIEAALLRVARSGRYILGPEVEAFEAEWAAYCGVKHCVGTGNALEALQLILVALGLRPGDEVIVPANTYIATWLSVTHALCTPVPVEPRLDTYNLDPAAVEAAVTPHTKAVIAVHLYGLPADMTALRAVTKKHRLFLLEDAAQAHGATLGAAKAGALGDAAAFSFYPSKNLGALGDAGAVTTNDRALAERVRRLRQYGGIGRLDHQTIGWNSRLDEMQAAVLRAKLPLLDRMNHFRRGRADFYLQMLKGARLSLPPATFESAWHQFVIRSEQRDELQAELALRGVDCHIHYPVPPHLEGAYRKWFKRGDFPVAERLAGEILSLPIGNDVDVEFIAQQVREAAA